MRSHCLGALREVREFFENASGVARNDGVGRHVFGNDAAGADNRVFANGDATEQCGAGANGGALFDQRGDTVPVFFGLELAVAVGRTRIEVVDEGDVVPDKDVIFECDAFAEK